MDFGSRARGGQDDESGLGLPLEGLSRGGRRGRGAAAGSAASGGEASEGVARGEDDGKGRKRRRTPRSDWQFPVLTDMGMRPERQRLLVIISTVVAVIVAGGSGS
ncbi:hypothetical protein GCM10020001_083120 [Nonomuraea salmonea]